MRRSAGNGKSITAMVISLAGACGLRILWINTIFVLVRTPECIYISYPISWFITLMFHLIFLLYFTHRLLHPKDKGKLRVQEAPEKKEQPVG